MAKRILVPLKWNEPPAAFVEALSALARGGGATVRLLHIGPPHDNVVDDAGRLVAYADQETRRLEAEARDFMQVVAMALGDVRVEVEVRFGDPVREILDEADVFDADLVVLGVRPRRRFVRIGGVAEQVFRRAAMPVALLRADHREPGVR